MFLNIEQNTPEWEAARIGKVTSSSMSKVMANYGKAFGEPAKKYAVQIALERITGIKADNEYTNEHMERGHEQEPEARALYEEINFVDVTNGGFFDFGNFGCSPDGLVNDDGLIEIKSVIQSVHFSNLSRQKFDPAYKWQLLSNLKFTGREWIDFVSYCATFPEGKKLYTYRINKKDYQDEFKQIDIRLNQFEVFINDCINEIQTLNYQVLS